MPDPNKWFKEYRAQCIRLAEQEPEKKKKIKKHLKKIEELWDLLPASHKKTVMWINTGNL